MVKATTDSGPELADPWGRPYHVRMETSGDGWIEDPFEAGARRYLVVLVYSAGPDGRLGTKDDIRSW